MGKTIGELPAGSNNLLNTLNNRGAHADPLDPLKGWEVLEMAGEQAVEQWERPTLHSRKISPQNNKADIRSLRPSFVPSDLAASWHFIGENDPDRNGAVVDEVDDFVVVDDKKKEEAKKALEQGEQNARWLPNEQLEIRAHFAEPDLEDEYVDAGEGMDGYDDGIGADFVDAEGDLEAALALDLEEEPVEVDGAAVRFGMSADAWKAKLRNIAGIVFPVILTAGVLMLMGTPVGSVLLGAAVVLVLSATFAQWSNLSVPNIAGFVTAAAVALVAQPFLPGIVVGGAAAYAGMRIAGALQ